jgi:hypothetical protein
MIVSRLGLIAILAPAALCGCSPETLVSSGRLVFDPAVVDFGVRQAGRVHELTTSLEATGADRVQIGGVRFSPESSTLLARRADGGSLVGSFVSSSAPLVVVIDYSPLDAGSEDTSLVVTAGAFMAILAISASAEAFSSPIAVLNPTELDFPPTEIGRDVVQMATLLNAGDLPGSPSLLKIQDPFSITFNGSTDISSTPIAGHDQRPLQVHFRPSTPESFAQQIVIGFDGGSTATIAVRGLGMAEGQLFCTPPLIDFGPTPRGTRVMRSIDCAPHGGVYTLAGFDLTQDAANLFSTLAPPTNATVTDLHMDVVFEASGVALPHSGKLDMRSTGGMDTVVQLAATVAPPSPDGADLLIQLAWTPNQTTFDLHLTENGKAPFTYGQDCYWEYQHLDWGAANVEIDDPFLDQRARDGVMPSTVSIERAAAIYDAYVQYSGHASTAPAPATPLTVTAWVRGNKQIITHTMSTCGNLWHVGHVDFSGGSPAFVADTSEMSSMEGASCP